MAKIYGECREVLGRTEWVAITSIGSDGPHTVATWGDHVRRMGVKDDEVIIVPAGKYEKTEEDLKTNAHLELMIASRQVQGGYGSGQGCRISGEGELQTAGEYAKVVKQTFPWARGALVIKVQEVNPQL